MLLELNENTVRTINRYISQVMERTAEDGGLHDMTISISSASTGLTLHCSRLADNEAEMRLQRHCERRKYIHKANSWFGLAVRPDGAIRFVAKLSGVWEFDTEMEAMLADISSGTAAE